MSLGEGEKADIYNDAMEVEWASLILTRRDVIDTIGPCDEGYYIYFEDVDFCLRAKKAGFKVVFTPKAISWHKGSVVVGKIPLRKYYYMHRNIIRLIIKNFDVLHMLISLVWWLLIRPVAYAAMTFPPMRRLLSITCPLCPPKTDVHEWRVLMKAIAWNLKNLRRTLRDRYRDASVIRRKSYKGHSKPLSQGDKR